MSQQLTLTRANSSVPDEGFYWTVAQYQIAHHRLKQELRAIAAGEPVNTEELTLRAAVFASKASILTEPSEVKNLLNGVPGFAEATQRVAELQRRIGASLEKEVFTQADAIKVLGEFKAMADDELLSRLASDVRLAEISAKDDMLRSLTRRIGWIWGGFALCWAALALWLLYAVRSRRRYRAAARDRQRAVEAMERAIVAKRKFLSMVSHEVRSPLQNIVASAELLAMKDSRPESVAAIRRIRHAVSVLQGQLRDLLTIARDDAGQWAMQAETFEFGELVMDVCAELEEAAHAKGLAFGVEVPEAPVTVNADPIRIAQVLRNLVENAVRNTNVGRIVVRLEPFDSDYSPGKDKLAADETPMAGWVRFSVQDTGQGLPPQALQRLQGATVPFESSSDGSGIGLFVIRDVLQQLRGQIDVQSSIARSPEGRGTTFKVSIPATLVRETAAQARISGNTDPLNILIVDDRPDVLKSLSDVTRRLGHSCIAVSSAVEAHSALARTRFDAVLIDLEMPGEDGLALATEIRSGDGPNGTLMLILISAAENRAVGMTWPFDGFLQKPIDCQALSRLIGSRNSH
ncbi:MAG: hybrid sensor histidine kinase/response regulator [Burkholderiales bacterium]